MYSFSLLQAEDPQQNPQKDKGGREWPEVASQVPQIVRPRYVNRTLERESPTHRLTGVGCEEQLPFTHRPVKGFHPSLRESMKGLISSSKGYTNCSVMHEHHLRPNSSTEIAHLYVYNLSILSDIFSPCLSFSKWTRWSDSCPAPRVPLPFTQQAFQVQIIALVFHVFQLMPLVRGRKLQGIELLKMEIEK